MMFSWGLCPCIAVQSIYLCKKDCGHLYFSQEIPTILEIVHTSPLQLMQKPAEVTVSGSCGAILSASK